MIFKNNFVIFISLIVVSNQSIIKHEKNAAISDPQQPGLAAILDFDIFIEDSAVLSSLLGYISL